MKVLRTAMTFVFLISNESLLTKINKITQIYIKKIPTGLNCWEFMANQLCSRI